MEFFVQHINAFIGTFLVALVGWFFSRKDKQISKAENLLGYYQKVANDLGVRLTEAIEKLNEAHKTIRELEEKVEALTDELRKYKQLNGKSK